MYVTETRKHFFDLSDSKANTLDFLHNNDTASNVDGYFLLLADPKNKRARKNTIRISVYRNSRPLSLEEFLLFPFWMQ